MNRCKYWPHMALGGLILMATTTATDAGILYPDPPDGWAYTYEGAADDFGDAQGFNALDGVWDHSHSDWWDGSAPGDGPLSPPGPPMPGGVGAFGGGEDGPTYLRIQDTGDPTVHGFPDPSNRKLYFTHDLAPDIPDLDLQVMDNGITISFRTRLATDGPLDDQYPEAAAPAPWPAGGKGYPIANSGRAMFNVYQEGRPGDDNEVLGFSLLTGGEAGEFGIPTGGLIMNNLVGDEPISAIDTTDPGVINIREVSDADLIDWREFWITIRPDPTGKGTHQVDVYMDGGGGRSSFPITAGRNTDVAPGASLAMGLSSGTRFGAFDVDFFSVQSGIFIPPSPTGDMDIDGDADFDDIPGFVLGLTEPAVYLSTIGVAPNVRGDTDGDGDLDFDDIPGFVIILGGTGTLESVPEPSTLVMACLLSAGCALLVVRGRRHG
ncbi:MAG: hypothetical protein ACC645_16315 [Pirellulales bacterium]